MVIIPMYSKQFGILHLRSEVELNQCECGATPRLIQFFVKGMPNHINWFVKCDACRQRTRRRRKPEFAVTEWNEFAGSLYHDGRGVGKTILK